MARIDGKYVYDHACAVCGKVRRLSVKHPKSKRCAPCAGRESYRKSDFPRADAITPGSGYITKQGYQLVFVDGKYQGAHTLVIPVGPGQIVHHVDGNKLKNVDTNLHACTRNEHRKIHHQLETLSYFLIQQGLLEFEDGVYRIGKELTDFVEARGVLDPPPGAVNIHGVKTPHKVGKTK